MKRLTVAVLFILTLAAGGEAFAAYSTPLSWNPMTMLDISFDSATKKLSIESNPFTADLNTDTRANGNGYTPIPPYPVTYASFDPSSPVSVLNGTVFSRRFGWNDANEGAVDGSAILDKIRAAYGNSAGIWIESISRSAGLKSYLAVDQDGLGSPNSYQGIFGTSGSSTKWQWDGIMDHNAYAVSLSDIVLANQQFSATYKIYVGDANGNDIDTNADTTTTWHWQVASGVPVSAPVPVPPAAWLLGSGIIGLFGIRRRTGMWKSSMRTAVRPAP